MKRKTSITLSPETLRALEEIGGPNANRSRLIEAAILEFVARRKRAAREARDLEILDRNAEDLNREMADVLEFQIEP